MKILLLSNHYPPYYKGGHEISMKFVADGLSLKGHDIFVLTSKYGLNRGFVSNNIFRLLYYSDGKANKYFYKRYVQMRRALLGRINYTLTKKAISSVELDIVFAGQLEGISVYPIKAIHKKGIPIVHHLGCYDFTELVELCIFERNPIKRFYRKVINGFYSLDEFDFQHILTHSEAVKNKYIEAGFSESNISAIPPIGIPAHVIKSEAARFTSAKNRTVKLLYVGRLVSEKGVHIAIESVGNLVSHFGRTNVTLDIIGDGDFQYIQYLNNLINKQDLTKYVHFRGKMAREDLFNEFSNYDVLLVPSIWEEPFGMIIIEAMSQGVPVVASSVGGIPEIIEDTIVGFLVPPNDPVKMSEAVYKLMENSSLAQRIALNAIDLINKKYTDITIIDQIDKYLARVIANKQ